MNEEERTVQVRLATAGDPDALQRLIIEYHNPLQATVAHSMNHVISRRLEPEDVLQDVHAAAYRTITGCTLNKLRSLSREKKALCLNASRAVRSCMLMGAITFAPGTCLGRRTGADRCRKHRLFLLRPK